MSRLTVRAKTRADAVLVYRYLQQVLLLKKEDVSAVNETSFSFSIKKDLGEVMVRILKERFQDRVLSQ